MAILVILFLEYNKIIGRAYFYSFEGRMSSQMKHYIFLIASSFVLLLSYSNCSFQPRSQVEPVKNEKVMPTVPVESSMPSEIITQ